MRRLRNCYSALAESGLKHVRARGSVSAGASLADRLEGVFAAKDMELLRRLVWKFKTRHRKAAHYRCMSEFYSKLLLLQQARLPEVLRLPGDGDDTVRALCCALLGLTRAVTLHLQPVAVKTAFQMGMLIEKAHYQGYAQVAEACVARLCLLLVEIVNDAQPVYEELRRAYAARQRQPPPVRQLEEPLRECQLLLGMPEVPEGVAEDMSSKRAERFVEERTKKRRVDERSVGADFFS